VEEEDLVCRGNKENAGRKKLVRELGKWECDLSRRESGWMAEDEPSAWTGHRNCLLLCGLRAHVLFLQWRRRHYCFL
jgi:hypothetical protein